MGGVTRFDFPRYVWSPSGGWWNNPRAWRSNTALAFTGALLLAIPVFVYSASHERRPIAPTRHIPSQRWSKHAKEDDPSL
eukprot:m.19309 g.19309  ORF g.19309 m.19309 type:complete len:80 (-) comp30886_c0_seq1:96-335(-)